MADAPPDFASYTMPTLASEPVPDWSGDAIDAGILAGLLVVWVMTRRLPARWRWLPLLAALAWLGFVRQGCLCPIGGLGAVLAALLHPGAVLPAAAVVLVGVPLLAALLWGRAFCGGVCPLGAIQEVIGVRSRRLPVSAARWLVHVPLIVLAATVVVAALGERLPCLLDPWVVLFRRSGHLPAWLMMGLWLMLAVVIWRPFCRTLCPLGAVLGLASRLAWRPRRIDLARCRDCGACASTCPIHAIAGDRIDAAACLDCGRCQGSCRSKAII